MDLKPKGTKFTYSKSKRSAVIPCTFVGRFAPPKREKAAEAEIELMVTSRSGNKSLSELIPELEQHIAAGGLFRVTGTMRRMFYQDRSSGLEVDRLSVYAFNVEASNESRPLYSVVQMEGGVRKVSDTDIYKNDGHIRKASFNLFCEPGSDFEQESYLTVSVFGFGEVSERVERMKLKEGSHVVASGKFEASNYGPPLSLRLYDLSYAARKKVKEG
jgi:hypothetical protein